MWWLHEVEIHLAISAFCYGAAFGLILSLAIMHFVDGSDKHNRH